MTAPPSDSRSLLDASVAAVSLQVTSENVLAVRDALLAEAKALEAGLMMRWEAATSMPQLAGDPISADAAVAFPAKTEALLTHCLRYVHDLADAAHALDRTARRYGIAEDDIVDTMHTVAGPIDSSQPALTMDQILNPHLYGGS